jgi:hypothetical protein
MKLGPFLLSMILYGSMMSGVSIVGFYTIIRDKCASVGATKKFLYSAIAVIFFATAMRIYYAYRGPDTQWSMISLTIVISTLLFNIILMSFMVLFLGYDEPDACSVSIPWLDKYAKSTKPFTYATFREEVSAFAEEKEDKTPDNMKRWMKIKDYWLNEQPADLGMKIPELISELNGYNKTFEANEKFMKTSYEETNWLKNPIFGTHLNMEQSEKQSRIERLITYCKEAKEATEAKDVANNEDEDEVAGVLEEDEIVETMTGEFTSDECEGENSHDNKWTETALSKLITELGDLKIKYDKLEERYDSGSDGIKTSSTTTRNIITIISFMILVIPPIEIVHVGTSIIDGLGWEGSTAQIGKLASAVASLIYGVAVFSTNEYGNSFKEFGVSKLVEDAGKNIKGGLSDVGNKIKKSVS